MDVFFLNQGGRSSVVSSTLTEKENVYQQAVTETAVHRDHCILHGNEVEYARCRTRPRYPEKAADFGHEGVLPLSRVLSMAGDVSGQKVVKQPPSALADFEVQNSRQLALHQEFI